MWCKTDDSKTRPKTAADDSQARDEFENLWNSGSVQGKRNLKEKFEKEENKSFESSSKVSAFPAIRVDNKDALKNILSNIPKVSKPQKKELILPKEKNQKGLTIPSEKSPRKGKSFWNEAEKLESDEKNKTNQAKHKLANNHGSFGPVAHRRYTFGLKSKYKIMTTPSEKKGKHHHRKTYTKDIPPLDKIRNYQNEDGRVYI